jgi:transcriptional regulator with XRE-family HTH domain
MTRTTSKSPTYADRYMGERIREARLDAKMTQDELAQLLGISYQQVQKYEAGTNRVNGGRINLLVTALNRPVTFFLPDITDVRAQADPMLTKFLSTREGLEIATCFPRLSPAWQGYIVKLVRLASETQAVSPT